MTDLDTMTPRELKDARHALGLSVEQFRKLVNVATERSVRRWETAGQDIPGPVVVIVRALLASAAVRAYFGFGVSIKAGRGPPRDRD